MVLVAGRRSPRTSHAVAKVEPCNIYHVKDGGSQRLGAAESRRRMRDDGRAQDGGACLT